MTTRLSRPETVKLLIATYGKKCFYCDREFTSSLSCTIDHFMPQSWCKAQGWTYEEINHIDNLRPACRPCNVLKGDVVPDEDGNFEMPTRRERTIKAPRPEPCDVCNSGRLIAPGDNCEDCGSSAQPAAAPAYIQRSPKECDHAFYHCWQCHLGFVERKEAAWWLTVGDE